MSVIKREQILRYISGILFIIGGCRSGNISLVIFGSMYFILATCLKKKQ